MIDQKDVLVVPYLSHSWTLSLFCILTSSIYSKLYNLYTIEELNLLKKKSMKIQHTQLKRGIYATYKVEKRDLLFNFHILKCLNESIFLLIHRSKSSFFHRPILITLYLSSIGSMYKSFYHSSSWLLVLQLCILAFGAITCICVNLHWFSPC